MEREFDSRMPLKDYPCTVNAVHAVLQPRHISPVKYVFHRRMYVIRMLARAECVGDEEGDRVYDEEGTVGLLPPNKRVLLCANTHRNMTNQGSGVVIIFLYIRRRFRIACSL